MEVEATSGDWHPELAQACAHGLLVVDDEPKWRARSRRLRAPGASAMNWSPMSMKAMPPPRPRSSSGPKIDSQNLSASSSVATSSGDVDDPHELWALALPEKVS
jgi:hypothetical protein